MSEVSEGPGWWQASDLKWYPPERHPQYVAPLPPPPAPLASADPPAVPAQAQSGAHRLSEIERNRILDRAISSRDRPLITGGIGWLRLHEPNITIDRSDVSAVVVWGKYFDSPGIVVLLALLSFVTCGLFLPIWFYYTLRRNRFAQKVSIDEYGLQHWGAAPIPPRQRVVSLLVLIALVLWIIWALNMWHSAKTGAY